MPRTKTAISSRVEALNAQLAARKATKASQQDERLKLVQDCHDNGGHVYVPVYDVDASGAMFRDSEVCMFCTSRKGASVTQVRRNLTAA